MDEIKLDETHYDVIILGTSLTETVLGAALAEAGKKVLNLDAHPQYGGPLASLTLADFDKWVKGGASIAYEEEERKQRARYAKSQEEHLKQEEARKARQIKPEDWQSACDAGDGKAGAYVYVPYTDACAFPCYYGATAQDGEQRRKRRRKKLQEQVEQKHKQEEQEQPEQQEQQPLVAEEDKGSEAAADAPATAPATAPAAVSARNDGDGDDDDNILLSFPELKAKQRKARQYTIDLSPRLLFARGELVELLIHSEVHRYMEFKAMDKAYLRVGKEKGINQVPISKSDVFTSNFLSLGDKRKLMKLLHAVMGDERNERAREANEKQLAEYADKPFIDLLRARKLSQELQSFVLYSIALLDADQSDAPAATTRDALASMKEFLTSLGRYGNGAFLYPMYGVSDAPQAFARACAVKGGTHILRYPPACVVYEPIARKDDNDDDDHGNSHLRNRFKGVVTRDGQFLTADNVVMGMDFASQFVSEECQTVSRCVCVTDKPLQQSNGAGDTHGMCVVTLPPGSAGNKHVVRAIQMDYNVTAAPRGQYMLYLYTLQSVGPEEDLSPCLKLLTRSEPEGGEEEKEEGKARPNVLWSAFYSQRVRTPNDTREREPNSLGDAACDEPSGDGNGDGSGDSGEASTGVEGSTGAQEQEEEPTAAAEATATATATATAASRPERTDSNIYLCGDPPLHIGFGNMIQHAREHFNHMYPGLVFFPSKLAQEIDDRDDHSVLDALEELVPDEKLARYAADGAIAATAAADDDADADADAGADASASASAEASKPVDGAGSDASASETPASDKGGTSSQE